MAMATERAQGRIQVGTAHSEVFFRVEGRATHLLAPSLRRVLMELEQRGFLSFRLDLSSCAHLDSTFLGVLAAAAMHLRERGGRLILAAVGPRNLDTLHTLGIDSYFVFEQSAGEVPNELLTLPDAGSQAQSWKDVVLEAHQALARADPANANRFEDVIRLLTECHADDRG